MVRPSHKMSIKESRVWVPANAAQPQATPWSRWPPIILVSAAVLLFAVLKLYSLNSVVIGDEHLYFNMAVLVNKGLIPHRDFFYTHPPLHLYLAAAAFRIFGYSLALGKLLPNLAVLGAGVLVFAIGRRALGGPAGAVACALFLLSYDPLRISSHFTGGNTAFGLAMVGLWLGYTDRPVLAGVAFGLGALVAVYVLPGAAAVALMCAWRSRGRLVRFVLAVVVVTLAGNLLMYAMAGWDFVYQVYVTQFLKGKEGALIGYTLYHRLGFIMYENQALTAGALAGLVLLVLDVRWQLRQRSHRASTDRAPQSTWLQLRADRRSEGLLLFGSWFVLFWIFYLSIRQQHAYYFLFIMPVFAWFSAYAYVEIGGGLVRLARGAGAHSDPRTRRHRRRLMSSTGRSRAAARVALGLVLTVATAGMVQALYVPFALRRYGTAVWGYRWEPLQPTLDRFIQRVFWQPRYDPMHPPLGITRYLQHETDRITVMDQIYAAVRRYTDPNDTIFGEVGLIPLVASETGRRIAANLVDTSSYRISYGLSRIDDWIARIEQDHVRLLVVRDRSLPMRYPQFRAYAYRNFMIVARIRDPRVGEFKIMRRIER